MLASLTDASLNDPAFVYEPKYDGIRVIAEIAPAGKIVRLWSRLGNEKTSQFPEIVAALAAWARPHREAMVLDGELVALDPDGRPAGFQRLQGRIHVKEIVAARRKVRPKAAVAAASPAPVSTALILFDLLKYGDTDWRGQPLTARRTALEKVVGKRRSSTIRLSDQVAGDGRALHARAQAEGWEGLIAKRASSRYLSGKRSPDWRKVKILHEQEFVVGGWTSPRQSRSYFGALLLGVYEAAAAPSVMRRGRGRKVQPSLIYCGHVGTGFDQRELEKVMAKLRALATDVCPFNEEPPTNEDAHWVKPELVAQVRFTEWTDDGNLRHPVYLGLRDDKRAADVVREEQPAGGAGRAGKAGRAGAGTSGEAMGSDTGTITGCLTPTKQECSALVDQLRAIEASRKDGLLELPGGASIKITNLHKIFWPRQKYTKGDLFRYYVQVAPFLLPAIADRALVMKRFPNGIAAPPFYQHRAEQMPDYVRVGTVPGTEARPQVVGGDLATLIYTTQLASISQDPWFSRVQTPDFADHVALDLDPAEGLPFSKVLDVARWIRDELQALGVQGFAKTSGSEGLHVYVPLPPKTSYEAGLLFAQIVAAMVTHKHPRVATVERAVRSRGVRVYVDCLQNIRGKTLASAYSARASDYAGVSTPLSWKEVDAGVAREDFTIMTMPKRLASVGDLWAPLATAKGIDLEKLARLGKT